MSKSTSIFIIFFVFTSCTYKENSWLNNYKEIKCKYSKIEELRSNDSLNEINNLGKNYPKLKLRLIKLTNQLLMKLQN